MITFTNPNTGTTLTVVPSEMKYSIMDISEADSGRDTTGTMHKNQVTLKNGTKVKKRKIELTFNGVEWKKCSDLLKAVDLEYFDMTYPDMKDYQTETRHFYVGDRECPVYTWWEDQKILSSVTFNCIEV